jgi:hypothetical protein
MASLLKSLVRTMRDNLDDSETHFHSAGTGRAYPCFDPRCTSPRRDLARDR